MSNRFKRAIASLGVSVFALVLALGFSMLIVALTGNDAGEAARAMWDGAFGNRAQIAGTLSKMIPLLLVALGWIVAYRAKRVNIGFEGQILAGGICATAMGLHFAGMPILIHLPLAVLAGVAGGAMWAGIAAWLWARRGVNEIISTLLLNFIAIEIVSWLVRGPLQESTKTFPRSGPIAESARWPSLLDKTSLSWDFVLAIVMVFVVAFVLNRTTFGYRLRFTGANEPAARHAGIATKTVTAIALIVSGALAGLAGELVDPRRRVHEHVRQLLGQLRLRGHRGRLVGPEQPDRVHPLGAALRLPASRRRPHGGPCRGAVGRRPHHPGTRHRLRRGSNVPARPPRE
ncbi:MAG: ABC transporter permease [Acidimicrobiia bacterium]|nr:ABC transporter permease [Acidimicrobiia bacterium]